VRGVGVHLTGLGLFLFIPFVLYLFVAHPEPIAASLVTGVVTMLGHRLVARPFMERVRGERCIWCAKVFAPGAAREPVALVAGDDATGFVACAHHAAPAGRFLSWVDRLRLPLRAGIALPLVGLLVALALAAAGRGAALPWATEAFRLVVGLTVNLAALGPTLGRPGSPPRAVFPPHNFALLGVRNLLWIFRLVGLWWIVTGAVGLARLAGA
jgi:hypothetical protein